MPDLKIFEEYSTFADASQRAKELAGGNKINPVVRLSANGYAIFVPSTFRLPAEREKRPGHPDGIRMVQFNTIPGSIKGRGALLCVEGSLRDSMLIQFENTFNSTGRHVLTGGLISKNPILTLVGSAGAALGLGSAVATPLYIATANPSTLMAIGNGVGSAVMGAGGIIAQAPFIPFATISMPILAPLLGFQALSSIVFVNQLADVTKRLKQIEAQVSRILQRSEATFIGEVISASNRLDKLERQYFAMGRFSPQMTIQLAQIEDKVNPIFERYRFLYDAQQITTESSAEDLRYKQHDAYLAISLSVIDLQRDVLAIRAAIQDEPEYLKQHINALTEKTSNYRSLWSHISKNPTLVKSIANELTQSVESMTWWQKNMPVWMRGRRSERIEKVDKAGEFWQKAEDYKKAIDRQVKDAGEFAAIIDRSGAHRDGVSLIYWKDGNGEHSYYTEDLAIVPPVPPDARTM